MKDIIVVGSGGHAKVVIDIIQNMKKFQICGITSNSIPQGELFYGFNVLGKDDIIRDYNPNSYCLAMGIGGFKDNNLRKKVYDLLKSWGYTFVKVIHPTAIISESCIIGEGTVVFPGAILNTEVVVGNNTIIATGATIDHETKIGHHVLVSAGVNIGAYCVIEDSSLIALGAKVISGISIRNNALVAAGAVVVKDVQEQQTVFGVPAKVKIV